MASKRRRRRLTGRTGPLCPTRKRRYLTAALAQLALLDVRNMRARRREGERVEQRIYSCPKCHGWHLTSMYLP